MAAQNEENADLRLLVSDLKVEASEAREQSTLLSAALKERSSELDRLRAEKEVMRTALVESSDTIGTLTENLVNMETDHQLYVNDVTMMRAELGQALNEANGLRVQLAEEAAQTEGKSCVWAVLSLLCCSEIDPWRMQS